MVTIYSNIFSKEPNYISVDKALLRIKEGRSKVKVEAIRQALDKERANELKKNLPSVCFSGKFAANRQDSDLIEHSAFIVLDFDDLEDVLSFKSDLCQYTFFKAIWISPSGKGVKALVKVKDGKKHRQHFEALKKHFPEADRSGINPSRVCYESYDPEIIINESCDTYADLIEPKEVTSVVASQSETFNNILKWLSNKGDAFRTGERNLFLYKLASACCRFGINEYECEQYFTGSFLSGVTDFSKGETTRTIKSAYKANSVSFGTAEFSRETLVNKIDKKEVEFDPSIYDLEVRPKDVIFGEDVKAEALDIYLNGYQGAMSTGIDDLDYYFKYKKGEITLLSGIGNYGKSTYLKYLLLIQVINGNKVALFAPEDAPAHEFYFDLTEMYLGGAQTPDMLSRHDLKTFEAVYDWISKSFFFVYPKDLSPTPDYIKERFLELIIKEKVTFCVIDPFNQMVNDYKSTGGRDDKYLDVVLSDFKKFALINDQCFIIVAHPKAMHKPKDALNYPEPDVFDLAGGAMWNNKMDNIIIYHRPYRGEDPENPTCTHSSKKIRRQKIVGKTGTLEFRLERASRRFLFGGIDYLDQAIRKSYGQGLEQNNDFLNDKPF